MITNQRQQKIAAYVLIALCFAVLLALLFWRPANAQVYYTDVADELVSCWNFDEESGSRSDAFGAYHLTDVNTVSFLGTGKKGKAALFYYPNNEYLSYSNIPSIANQPYTVAFWVLPYEGSMTFFESRRNEIKIYTGSAILIIQVEGVQYFIGQSPQTGAWHHIVVSITGNNMTVWLDGKKHSITLNSALDVTDSTYTSLYFGRNNTAGYLYGAIDQPAIWSRVITDDEALWLYNAGAARTCQEIIDAALPEYAESYFSVPLSTGTLIVNRVMDYGDIAVVLSIAILLLMTAVRMLHETISRSLS